jgi:multiple sugar transport system substrate-binding protein
MNAGSKKKDAAWLFMQWATGKDFLTTAVVEPQYTMVNPVRQSVIDNPAFQERMEFHTDYMSTLKTISEGDMRIHFTPSPIFFETTTEWAQALQDIYAGADAQTRLDALVKSLTEQLQDVGILE